MNETDQSPPGTRPAALPAALLAFARWSAGLALCSLLYTFVCGSLLHLRYPYALPLFHSDLPYWDFTVFRTRFAHFRQPAFWDAFNYPFTYPAPTALAFAAYYALPRPLLAYANTCIVAALIGAGYLLRALIRRGISMDSAASFVLILIFTCWPLGYMFNRANIEGLVAIIVGLGLLCLLYERWWIGSTLLALAASMKIFPAVLLALLLARKRYKEFAWSCAAMVAITVLSLAVLGPTRQAAQDHIADGLQYFHYNWASNLLLTEVGFDHSPFTLLKVPYTLHHAWRYNLLRDPLPNGVYPYLMVGTGPGLDHLLSDYVVFSAVFGLVLYFVWIRKLPFLNQMLALSICAVSLPPVSFDYTLVHLLVPFALLCVYAADASRQRLTVSGLKSCFICFALVFTTGAFLTYRFRWAGQFRAVALLALLYLVLRYGFHPIDNPDTAPAPRTS